MGVAGTKAQGRLVLFSGAGSIACLSASLLADTLEQSQALWNVSHFFLTIACVIFSVGYLFLARADRVNGLPVNILMVITARVTGTIGGFYLVIFLVLFFRFVEDWGDF